MNTISTIELKQLIDSDENFTLLDCRGPESYTQEHIPTAINLRSSEVPEKAHQLLPDKTTLIITSCTSLTCTASTNCYENLESLGYINLKEYPGGLSEWKAHGYSTVISSG